MKIRNIIGSFLIIVAVLIIAGAAGNYTSEVCAFGEWIAWELFGFSVMFGGYYCFDESLRT